VCKMIAINVGIKQAYNSLIIINGKISVPSYHVMEIYAGVCKILSRVWGSVTNNNGSCIGLLHLLALLYNYSHNQ
jgi:hypothetical protein